MSHSDPERWRRGLFTLRTSLTVPIFRRSLLAAGWSVVVKGLVDLRVFGTMALTAHTLIGVAFGLLLVFRTNTSYDRFWEGRRLWGAIVEESRNLARLASVHLPEARRHEFRSAVSVAAHATMHGLRVHRDLGPRRDGLAPEAVVHVEESAHLQTAALTRAAQIVRDGAREGVVPEALLPSFEESCRAILLAAGGCNRIRSTPIPFAYTVHLRRVLTFYAFTVPFALARDFGWLTVVATFVVTFVLFGIEEIGASIEDPFGLDANDLPIEQYCQAIDACLFDASLDRLAALAPPPAKA